MKRRYSARLSCALLGCLLLALLFANSDRALAGLARWLNVGGQAETSDYVLILNGDSNVRPFVGAMLYQARLASRVLLVPTKTSASAGTSRWPTSHELARRILILRGVPAEQIVELPGSCENTFDEAAALRRFLNSPSEAAATVSVVTSHFHTRRARWIFRQLLGAEADRLRFVAAPVDGFDESNWWRSEEGFVIYVMEYLKLLFYVFRYGNGIWVCAFLAVAGTGVIVGRRYSLRHPAAPVHE